MRTRQITLILLMLVLAIATASSTAAQVPMKDKATSTSQVSGNSSLSSDKCSNFISLSKDLGQMEDLFHGGNGELVEFDLHTARQRGFNEDSIALAEELAAYTNDLILAANELRQSATVTSVELSDVTLEKYPRVRSYFECAAKYHRDRNLNAPADYTVEGWCNPWLTDEACSCGHWWYPRPDSAAPWESHSSSDPAATLTSWGYHETPDFAGGGWTRPQTYYPSRCGYNTYRDHAIITGSTTFNEQDYAGFTPRGEPNPEFWAGGPWPYATWPAYVAWWHDNF